MLVEAVYEALKYISPPGVEPWMFVLTYLLSFAMIWPLTGIIHFMKDNRAVRIFVTLVISYFIAASGLVTLVISKFFPAVGMSIMVVFGILLVLALIFPEMTKKGTFGKFSGFLLLIAFLIVVWVTWYGLAPSVGAQPGTPVPGLSIWDWLLLIVILVVVLGIILWALGGKEGGGEIYIPVKKI